MTDDKMAGNTRRQAFLDKHSKKGCQLYEKELLDAKDKWSWGKSQITKKTLKPWGCPVGHSGPEERPEDFRPRIRNKSEPKSPPSRTQRTKTSKKAAPLESDDASEIESQKSTSQPRYRTA